MKALMISMIAITTIAAIAIGWFYKPKITVSRTDLEIPTNIDYFLTGIQYKSMNEHGNLDFEMQSPYLEHLIASNISVIDQPTIKIYQDLDDWQIESFTGKLLHEQNSLQLEESVVMRREGNAPLQVLTEVILFQPDLGLIRASKKIQIKSNTAVIHGSEGIFNLKKNVYSLKNIKAIYHHENS